MVNTNNPEQTPKNAGGEQNQRQKTDSRHVKGTRLAIDQPTGNRSKTNRNIESPK